MPRTPQATQAMTGAERQARYRARHRGPDVPPARPVRSTPTRTVSRVQRWNAAVETLTTLQAEYAAWLDALPEATRDSATGAALQAIVDLDLDEITAVVPPRGFGRD